VTEIETEVAERVRTDAARLLLRAVQDLPDRADSPGLERRASTLLRELSDGRYDALSLDDDYEVSIGYGAVRRSIREVSGGEEDLANLCLRISIGQLISESTGLGSAPVILDEVLGSQDGNRRERIMDLLPRLAAHFPQVLMVAHLPEVQDRFPTTLRLTFDPLTETSRLIYPTRRPWPAQWFDIGSAERMIQSANRFSAHKLGQRLIHEWINKELEPTEYLHSEGLMNNLIYGNQQPDKLAASVEEIVRKDLNASDPITCRIVSSEAVPASVASVLTDIGNVLGNGSTTLLLSLELDLPGPRKATLLARLLRQGIGCYCGSLLFTIVLSRSIDSEVTIEGHKSFGSPSFSVEKPLLTSMPPRI